jgi:ribosomal protein S18 acetylase RimI-like enzyme
MAATTDPQAPARSVTLRPIEAADQELLYRIYASTRALELAPVPWSDEQKEAFLRQQFRAQSVDYAANYPAADCRLILVDGEPAGRLYVDRSGDAFHVIDIALLPDHRGHGLGGALLGDIQAQAGAAGRPVRIHVERFNPALRLYQRLGFQQSADQGVYFLMEWRAPAAP